MDSCACVSTGFGPRRCAYRRTRPLGGSRWRHYVCSLLGVHWFPLKCGRKTVEWYGKQVCHMFGRSYYSDDMLCVLALVRLPSLHGYYAGMVYWENGALRGDYRHILCKTFFPSYIGKILGAGALALVDWLGLEAGTFPPSMLQLRYSMTGAGLHIGIWLLKLRWITLMWLSHLGACCPGFLSCCKVERNTCCYACVWHCSISAFFDCGRAIRCRCCFSGW